MKSHSQHICALFGFCILINIGCKSYSKYPIDATPKIKIDTGILGLWKAVEDTDKANYFCIESDYNTEVPNIPSFKFEHDNKSCLYYITYMDMHGSNPLYQQFYAFISIINRQNFLNIAYHHTPYVDGRFVSEKDEKGYFFTRLIKVTKDSIITAVVADTTLKQLTNSKDVRKRLEKNSSRPSFYSDTMHFYRVSSYRGGLKGSEVYANPQKKN